MDSKSTLRALRDELRRHLALLLLATAVLAAAAFVGPRLLWGPRVVVDTVVQRDFVQSIVASGRVETPHRIALGVQLTGSVQAVPVVEGQAVKAGAPLIELDDAELRAALAQADSGTGQAIARLRQVVEVQGPVAEQALNQARSNHAMAQAALARSQELFARGFVGRAALDEAERSERVAAAQRQGAERQFAGTGPRGSDMHAAQAALAQARAAAQVARARLGHAVVLAPVDGVVTSRNVEPGDTVQAGKVLMSIAPVGTTQVVAQIDEKNLALLRSGQRALVSADAYERERFPADLVFIHPGIDPQRGSIEVRLDVPSPPGYLRQDMTVSVEIEVARRAAAVLVPTTAVRGGTDRQPWVWTVRDGRVARQAVVLGARTAEWTEVRQGLAPGTAVLPPEVRTPTEGMRVRAVRRTAAAS